MRLNVDNATKDERNKVKRVTQCTEVKSEIMMSTVTYSTDCGMNCPFLSFEGQGVALPTNQITPR